MATTDPLPPLTTPDRDGWGRDIRLALTIAGWLLIILWCWFWLRALQNGRVVDEWVRIPAWRFLGLDFVHNYLGVSAWLDGRNPYHEDIGDRRGSYAYPPIVLLLYAWSGLFRRGLAIVLWMGFRSEERRVGKEGRARRWRGWSKETGRTSGWSDGVWRT